MVDQYKLPLFPLNTVLFPKMLLPLHIFEERYKAMIRRCVAESQPFGVVLLKSGRAEGPLGNIYGIGTTAQITQMERLPDERMNILTVGQHRFRIVEIHHDQPYLTGIVENFPLINSHSSATQQAAGRVLQSLTAYLKKFKELGQLDFDLHFIPDEPETLAFLIAVLLSISNKQKQELLSISSAQSILDEEYHLLRHERDILAILAEEPTWLQQETAYQFSNN